MSEGGDKFDTTIERIEQMFYSVEVRAIVRNEALRQEQGGEVLRLKAQLERVQGRRLDAPMLPTHPAFASLLPGGGLRPGAAYSLGSSASLLLALMARPSQDGSWCAVVGMPELGAEAAESLGVDLARLVFVPDPGPRWLAVTATIAEVAPVVAVRPPTRVADGQVARLAARLRDRGTVLLVQGAWPQAEATLDVGDPQWSGVGRGHGYLAGREVTVTAASRRWPRARRERMLLPGADGQVALVTPAYENAAPIAPVAPVRAVGPLQADSTREALPVHEAVPTREAGPTREAAPVRAVPAVTTEERGHEELRRLQAEERREERGHDELRRLQPAVTTQEREHDELRQPEAEEREEREERRQERLRIAMRVLEAVG
jgi:hypothetical protein